LRVKKLRTRRPIVLNVVAAGDIGGGRARCGSALVLAMVSLVVLMTLGLGVLTIAWGSRHTAARFQREVAAMLAAEAGYEKAIYWMSQQPDMLSALQSGASGSAGTLSFPDSRCEYKVGIFTFLKHRPVYRIVATGYSGVFEKSLEVLAVQAISGWDMGMCRVPSGKTSTYPVNFADGEIIDIPVQINNLRDSPDYRDIYIIGEPRFKQIVTMSEKRHTEGGADKYASVMDCFESRILFSQPECRITDEATVRIKTKRFEDSTKPRFIFKPVGGAAVRNAQPAVHLEFFVDEMGVGKVRITNNCTVRGFKQADDRRTWDFRIKSNSNGREYERYPIYAYHLMPEDADQTGQRFVVPLRETYVTQSYGEYESVPGGQIYVEGNVVIGSGDRLLAGQDVVKGNMTVVATGNIWIADSIVVAGDHASDGRPGENNQNVLGLIALGVVRVVDPGMSDYGYVDDSPVEPAGYKYVPIGRPDNPFAVPGDPDYHRRHLPDPTVVEAAITSGGGGWGAENVRRGYYGGRKERSGRQDYLILRGTLVEATRGVVGLVGADGYLKRYYFDERLLEGILPGDMWLRSKYVPAPSGWNER